ncbi:hypothetical protein SH1V18_40970 [Vallitalea longa]|uniref:L,D-TPase catalytic domain-containing protein n=1 Tax=Vallitalea longa TaxID=2936439 RepID=A0A9W5YDQ8_9FIRM|nr:L,D-transpeptidase family protein [Vallitalea longa]GKX31617.1 hypothetical protein SH1V18_40970 [Vallitalea longa]
MKYMYIKIVLTIILIICVANLICLKRTNENLLEVFFSQNNNPYYILVDLDTYIMYVFKDNEMYKEYPVSGGKYSTPSPLGTWNIVSKANWGEGFGGTWMGFNVPWGKYGIHGTDEPWSIGSGLSKGCIRMYNDDAKDLKKYIPYGTKVTIIKGPYGPFGDGLRTLTPGDTGSDVFAVQERLKELGYYKGYCDGKYGDGLKSAIFKYENDKGLPRSYYITETLYESLGFIPFE